MSRRRPQPKARRLAGKRVMFHGKFELGEQVRLGARATALGATIENALTAKVDVLVLPHAISGKTIRQKALSLNAKGAAIQIVDAATFRKDSEPTADDLLALIRGGKANARTFRDALGDGHPSQVSGTNKLPLHQIVDERFDGLDLEEFNFEGIAFERCSFVGAKLATVTFDVARDCDFSRAKGDYPTFNDISGSKFAGAAFESAAFEGRFDRADFSGARLEEATFHLWRSPAKRGSQPVEAPVFRRAKLTEAEFTEVTLVDADFSGTDLTRAKFEDAELGSATFRGAKLNDASLEGCRMPGIDLSKADLRGANFADTDLMGAKFAGANVNGCNFYGAKVEGEELARAKGVQPGVGSASNGGASLEALDRLTTQMGQLDVSFRVRGSDGDDKEAHAGYLPWVGRSFSDSLRRVANEMGHRTVRFETVRISGLKLPRPLSKLRELVLGGIAEAFGQSPPEPRQLTAATHAFRRQEAREAAAVKRQIAAQRAAAKQRKRAAKARAIDRLATEAGDATDFGSFMKAIVIRTDADKVLKASKMLKASRFELFNEVAADHLLGVVKSQTDPGLVYACRIGQDGHYACCTQNLNVCGGLRGSVCKHLLVMIIGLVKAGQLNPATIEAWLAKTHGVKPAIDKEIMSEIFIRYKGAEAGEVDWRPTETVPEDYYAL